MKIEDFNPTYTYVAEGRVLGNFWGGGKGSYKARQFVSKTSIDDLIETLNKALKDGSLDSGMGYESLIGAVLIITKQSIIEYESKTYKNYEDETVFIGNLTDKETEFLSDIVFEQMI